MTQAILYLDNVKEQNGFDITNRKSTKIFGQKMF